MLEKLLETVCGTSRDGSKIEKKKKKKIKGTVVLKKKNVMDCTDVCASVLDKTYEIFGKAVLFHLISSTHDDPANGGRGKLGKAAYLEKWVSKITSLSAEFNITFYWDIETLGIPGALIVKNHHYSQFYLKTVELHDVPQHGTLHFVCNSWVYPMRRYEYNRLFFTNKTYLPGDTPEPLRLYREEELIYLRGTGSGMLKPWDRVYDYAYYNDLGSPEKGIDYSRPVLGGSKEYPYPRRGRTGRPPNEKDPNSETRLPLLSLNVYVPKDEKFSQVKFSDFIGDALKSLGQVLIPEIKSLFDKTFNEFDTFQDVLNLYEGGIKLPDGVSLHKIRKRIPWELLKELLHSDGERFLKFPMPDVIKEDRTAWRTDEEFGREMLAGVNPVNIRHLEVKGRFCIRMYIQTVVQENAHSSDGFNSNWLFTCLMEFPPTSKLDPQVYGNQHSTMTREHIEQHMQGFTVEHAIASNRLFILDHHDAMMTYLRRINTTATKTYATRTLLLLQENGTLKPIAIELSLPHENGDKHGAVSQVFTPCQTGVEGSIWQLAKAYAAVNDSGYHQLISHWLNTHAVIEPFIIATNRQLSVLHPIYKILKPHFRDTMHINALARQILINAGGVVEATVFPARYAMEMSSAVYKNWNFTEQGLPEDLLKRGMAIKDSTKPHGLRLLIDDYPYAVDGLDIWSAIEAWVDKYCRLYYPSNETIEADSELQSWWTEIREVGHGDIKNEPWWPKLHTQQELIKTCSTIIWIASALHAAVNFGQYPYAGYLPNRPTVSRRLMPKPGTREYTELESNPDSAFLKTITAQFQTLLGVSLIEILSRHSTDEIYLGQRDDPEWTDDERARDAFREFSCALMEIEKRILERNNGRRLRNRWGPVQLPYTLLYPNTSDESKEGGLGVRGIPNSITI